MKDLAAIREKLPEAKPPSLGVVAASEGSCRPGTGTGTALGDRAEPWPPVLGHSTEDELVPQPQNPSLVLADPSSPEHPVTQRAHTAVSPRQQGDRRDPPQPAPGAAPAAEGSSPLPALRISIGAGARDPSAAALGALTGLVAPGTGDTGDPGGTPSLLGPRGLPRPTQDTANECKRPLSSSDTFGIDVLDWLHGILAGSGFPPCRPRDVGVTQQPKGVTCVTGGFGCGAHLAEELLEDFRTDSSNKLR
ncbi:hypothetical protein Nmel_018149 [Mimus melanotis]